MHSASAKVDARFVDWGDASGPYHATLNPSGKANQVSNNVMFEPWAHLDSVFETFESGTWGTAFFWLNSGDGDWHVSDSTPLHGSFSAKAPTIPDGQQATLKAVVPCRAGHVAFRYAVDSEENADQLEFYIDGTLVGSWSGAVPDSTTPLSDAYKITEGVHTFEWVWVKNESGSAGADTAWIDNVVIPRLIGHLEGTVVTDASGEPHSLLGATVTLTDGTNTYTTTTDENGGYIFYNVPYGDYTLTIESDDFVASTQNVTIGDFGIASLTPVNLSVVDTSTLYTPTQVQEAVDQATDGLYTPMQVDQAVNEAVDDAVQQATQDMYTQEQLDQAVDDALANVPTKPQVVVVPMF